MDLARLLAPDREASKASETALDFLARRGFAVPSDTAVLYAVVETDANQRVNLVVGVFRSARDAEAYADAVGWPDFAVAPYRLHPSWQVPGQL